MAALSNSLEPVEITSPWQAELAGRIDRIERGDAILHDAEAHLRTLRSKYGG